VEKRLQDVLDAMKRQPMMTKYAMVIEEELRNIHTEHKSVCVRNKTTIESRCYRVGLKVMQNNKKITVWCYVNVALAFVLEDHEDHFREKIFKEWHTKGRACKGERLIFEPSEHTSKSITYSVQCKYFV